MCTCRTNHALKAYNKYILNITRTGIIANDLYDVSIIVAL